jgi:asparagine synthase (glutamine-hydrolysing)
MSALFGFTGAKTPKLADAMRTALAHRGQAVALTDAAIQATVGFISDHPVSLLDQLGAGQWTDPEHDLSITLAGQVLAPRPTQGSIGAHLLADYKRLGLEMVEGMRGGFVMAIRDGDTVHLVRDGVGVRTLVWAQHEGRTVFAVESKGITAVPGFPRRLRPAAIAQYLSFSFVPGAGTMLEGIEEMLPGHILTLRPGHAPKLRRWFHFEHSEASGEVNEEEWVSRVADTTALAVAERMPSNRPFATFLSGGLDSSLVLAELRSQGVERPKTFSIHFGDRYDNELKFAHLVAKHCGADHTDVLIEPRDFLPRMRRAIWHMDAPIGDPITIPNFELARQVGRDFSWVFNGEGGDPLFGGPKNITMMMHQWYGSGDRSPGARERQYLASYRRAYSELDHLLSPEMRGHVEPRRDLEGILTPFFEAEAPVSFLDKLLAINLRLKGAHLILPKIERMLGAWGVTPLSPLFDERLVRLSFSMPGQLKLRDGIEKIALKRAYVDRLPPEIIARPKSGMRVPVHHWFQDELRRTARRVLSKRRVKRAGIFNPERVEQLLQYNISQGPGRYGLRLWMLLTFEIWRQMVIEGEAP